MPKVKTLGFTHEVEIEHGQAKVTAVISSKGEVEILPKKGNMFNFQHTRYELVSDIAQCLIKVVETAKTLEKDFVDFVDEEAAQNGGTGKN